MIYKVDDINLPIKKRNKLLDLVFVDHKSKELSEEEIKNTYSSVKGFNYLTPPPSRGIGSTSTSRT